MRPGPFWTRWKRRKRECWEGEGNPSLEGAPPPPNTPPSPLPRLSRAVSSLSSYAGTGRSESIPLNFLDSSTPDAQPPHQSNVFEEEGGGLEGEGETFSESFPFPPPMFYSPPSFSECSFLKMVLRLTLKTSATFWTDPCTLRALRRMPRSMSAMMSLRGRS